MIQLYNDLTDSLQFKIGESCLSKQIIAAKRKGAKRENPPDGHNLKLDMIKQPTRSYAIK